MSSLFTSKDVSHVPRFDGSNFPLWKFQISLMLEHHDLMALVIGNEKQPDPTTSSEDGVEAVTNADVIKTWKQRDNSARLFIVSTIDHQQQRSLINCKTASQMWARLTSQFEMSASENKQLLMQRFFEYPYQQGNDVMSHITAVESLANQLTDVGAEVSEDQIISKVICTLPPSFRHVVAAWENLEDLGDLESGIFLFSPLACLKLRL